LNTTLLTFGGAVRAAENLSDCQQFALAYDDGLFFLTALAFGFEGYDVCHGLSTLIAVPPRKSSCEIARLTKRVAFRPLTVSTESGDGGK
jgi:hypothetical protein